VARRGMLVDFLEAAETNAPVTAPSNDTVYEGDNRPTYIKERTNITAEQYNQFLAEFDDAVAQANVNYRQATLVKNIEREAGASFDPESSVLENQQLQNQLFEEAVSGIAEKYGVPLTYTTKGGERWELNNNGKYTRVTQVGGFQDYIPALVKAGITAAATAGLGSWLSAPAAGSAAAAQGAATGMGLGATTADVLASVITTGATTGWDPQQMLAAAVSAGIPVDEANKFVEGALRSGANAVVNGESVDEVLKTAVLGGTVSWGIDALSDWSNKTFGDATDEAIDALQERVDITDSLEAANTLLSGDATDAAVTAITNNQTLRDAAATAMAAGSDALEEVVVTAQRLYPDISASAARTLLETFAKEDAGIQPTTEEPTKEEPVVPEEVVVTATPEDTRVAALDENGNPIPYIYEYTTPSGETKIYFSGMPEFSPEAEALKNQWISNVGQTEGVERFQNFVRDILSGIPVTAYGVPFDESNLFAKNATPIETVPEETVVPEEPVVEEQPEEPVIPETKAILGDVTTPTPVVTIPTIEPPSTAVTPDVSGGGSGGTPDTGGGEDEDVFDSTISATFDPFVDTTLEGTDIPTTQTPVGEGASGGEVGQGTTEGTGATGGEGVGTDTGVGEGAGAGEVAGEGTGVGDGAGEGSGSGTGGGTGMLSTGGSKRDIRDPLAMLAVNYGVNPASLFQSVDYLDQLIARLQQ